MKAVWNGVVVAESRDTIVVENNHYFPPESVNQVYLVESNTKTTCPWKGISSYKNVVVDGEVAADGAWYYPEPKDAAARLGIKDYYAFWHGVDVVE